MHKERDKGSGGESKKTERDVFNLIYATVQFLRRQVKYGQLDFAVANGLIPSISLVLANGMRLAEGPGLAFAASFDREMFMLLLQDAEAVARRENDTAALQRIEDASNRHIDESFAYIQHVRAVAVDESEHTTEFGKRDVQMFLETLDEVAMMTAISLYVNDTIPSLPRIHQDVAEISRLGSKIPDYVGYLNTRAREFYTPITEFEQGMQQI